MALEHALLVALREQPASGLELAGEVPGEPVSKWMTGQVVSEAGRRAALEKLLPAQRSDFTEIFEIMAGLLVQVRPYMGLDLLLPLFAAAILGGIGSVPGAMFGAVSVCAVQSWGTTSSIKP